MVTRIANALTSFGVRRQDAVTLSGVNTSMLYAATLAAQAVGIAAPVNPALGGERLAELLRRTQSRVLVAAGPELDEQLWQRLLAVARQVGMAAVLVLRPDGVDSEAPALPTDPDLVVTYLDDVIAGQPDDRLVGAQPPAAQDLAAFVHTGGTTGSPKVAAHTHANQLACGQAIAQSSGLTAGRIDPRRVAAVPRQRVARHRHRPDVRWAAGGVAEPSRLPRPGLYARFWQIVEHYQIVAMSAVPTVYSALSRVPVDADISSLRIPIVGASPLPASVREAFAAHTGRRLLEGYGLTEATCASTFTPPGEERIGSVGRALPQQQVKAVRIGRRWVLGGLRPGRSRPLDDQRARRVRRLRHRPQARRATGQP